MNKDYPPSTKPVFFLTKFVKDEDTGDYVSGWHKGFFLKDANKYVRNVNRWKDTDEHKWYNDEDVIGWEDRNA